MLKPMCLMTSTFQVYRVTFCYAPTYILGGNQTWNWRSIVCSLQNCHRVLMELTQAFFFLPLILPPSSSLHPHKKRWKTTMKSVQYKTEYLKINLWLIKLVLTDCTLYARHRSKYWHIREIALLSQFRDRKEMNRDIK